MRNIEKKLFCPFWMGGFVNINNVIWLVKSDFPDDVIREDND